MIKRIYRSSLIVFAFLTLLVGAQGETANWTANDAMVNFFGAVRTLQDEALTEKTLAEWVSASLECVLKAHDPYAEYLEPAEYRRWRDAQKPSYGGIGVELRRVEGGRFLCFPYADSPARRAGVQDGDRLLSIDGEPVDGKSLYAVVADLRGPPNSVVRLSFEQVDTSLTTRVAVLRTRVQSRTVVPADLLGTPVLQVYGFDSTTVAQLLEHATASEEATALVLDLRGNQGGDLFAAIDVARLFLPAGSEILQVEKRSGTRSHTAVEDGPLMNRPVVLLQNRDTASAAEILIAALTGNERAVAYGENSQGKGRTQRVVTLLNGGAMIITDGRLIGPNGLDWNETGLVPVGDLVAWQLQQDVHRLQSLWNWPWVRHGRPQPQSDSEITE